MLLGGIRKNWSCVPKLVQSIQLKTILLKFFFCRVKGLTAQQWSQPEAVYN